MYKLMIVCIFAVGCAAKSDYDPWESYDTTSLPPAIERCKTDTDCEFAADLLCAEGALEWCDNNGMW